MLEVRGLTKHFPVTQGVILQRVTGAVRAVDGVDFTIPAGTTFGLVGESGCGKSTTAKLILLLERKTSGSIRFDGKEVNDFKGAGLRAYRAAVQAVFQDPYSSLNPRMRVADIVTEPAQILEGLGGAAARRRAKDLLELVALPAEAGSLYPHEFSGGQRQRIAIARSLAVHPRLIVLDEPVSALDVSIRAQILNLLRDIQKEFGLAYLLISHNLATVRHMCDTAAVMYLGKIVEMGTSAEVFGQPKHPYTQALFAAALPSHPRQRREEDPLPGEVPSPLDRPSGCPFRTRCAHAMAVCEEVEPPLLAHADESRVVACHLYEPAKVSV